MNRRNLLVRSLTGIVIVWVMLSAVASENAWYYVLWVVIGALSLREFFVLMRKSRVTSHKSRITIFGTIYIVLPLVLLCTLKDQWQYVVVFLTLVWINDIGAYAIGSVIGRHPMAPKISPKKSWEGFFAGVIASTAVALVWWGCYFQGLTTPTDSSVQTKLIWALFGLVIALGSVAGDLAESKFKRVLGIKDSGTLLAGHGGMLDRFDALYVAAIPFWLFVQFVLPL